MYTTRNHSIMDNDHKIAQFKNAHEAYVALGALRKATECGCAESGTYTENGITYPAISFTKGEAITFEDEQFRDKVLGIIKAKLDFED